MSLLSLLNLPAPKGGAIKPQPIIGITATQGVETTTAGARPIAVKAPEPEGLAGRLAARDKMLREAYDKLARNQARLETEIGQRSGDTKATMQAQKAEIDKHIASIDRQLKQLDADRKALASPATDAKTMNDILARSKSAAPVGKATEVDKHDNPFETSPLKKQTTTTTTSVADGKSTTEVSDKSTSVGAGGVARKNVDSTQTVSSTGGSTTTNTTTRTLGKDGYTGEKTTTKETEAGGQKTSTEEKKSFQAGPGGITAGKETKTTAADGSGTSSKTSGGLERGDGKAGGVVSTTKTNTNASGGSTTRGGTGKGGLQAGDGGVGAYGEGKGSVEKKGANGLSAGAVAGLNANIKCSIKPVVGEVPPRYVLQTQINLGASLKLSAGGEKEGKGKAGVSASGSAVVYMNCSHTLLEPEAQAYVAALKTGGAGKQPELAIIRTGLSKSWDDAQKMYLALTGKIGSAADFDAMGAGDSKTVGRKTTAGAGVNASGGPVGIELDAEKSQEREMTVTKGKDGSATYDTKQGQGDKKSAGANVTMGVASGGVAIGKTVTTATGYKFLVKPDMKDARALQDQIAKLANASQAEVDAFAKAHPETVVERVDVRDDAKDVKVNAGVAGVKATFLDGAGIEDTVTRDRDGKITDTKKRGHNEGGLAVSAGGKQIGTDIKEEAGAREGADGQRMFDVKRAQGDTDVVDLLDSLPLVGGKKKDKSALETATGAKDEPAVIRQVAGVTLSGGDLKALAGLANEPKEWNKAAMSPRDLADWGKAAAEIRKAGGDPKAVEDALARFVGKDSMRARIVTRAVRPVGDVSSGTRWEFPNSIGSLQKAYQDLVVAASEKQLTEAAKDGDKAKGKAVGKDLLSKLASMYAGVKSASDFKDKAVQQEMLTAIGARQRRIEIELRKLDGADDAAAEKGQERADFERALESCIGYQQTETDYFKQIEAEHKKTFSNADPAEVMRITVEIKNLHAIWGPQYDRMAMFAQENGWAKDRYFRFKPDKARLATAVKTGKAGEASEVKPETEDKRRKPDAVSDKRSAEMNREVDSTGWKKYNTMKSELANLSAEVTRLAREIKEQYAKAPNAQAEKLFNQANGPITDADTNFKLVKPNDMPSMFDYGHVAIERYRQGVLLLRKARAAFPK
jgi:hypothetical protein